MKSKVWTDFCLKLNTIATITAAIIKRKRVRHICVTNDSRVIRTDGSIDFWIVFVGLSLWSWYFFFLAFSRIAGREKLVLNLSWPIINHHHQHYWKFCAWGCRQTIVRLKQQIGLNIIDNCFLFVLQTHSFDVLRLLLLVLVLVA